MRQGYRRERFQNFDEHKICHHESVTTFSDPPSIPPLVAFWSACFHFSSSDTLEQVPYITYPYLFFGEEILMGAR